VRAGLGVAVFPQSLIPDDLVKVTNKFGLPTLGEVDFTLFRNPSAPPEATEALISAILGRALARG
jgi:DNA-binding transcriptional LysR family regulator